MLTLALVLGCGESAPPASNSRSDAGNDGAAREVPDVSVDVDSGATVIIDDAFTRPSFDALSDTADDAALADASSIVPDAPADAPQDAAFDSASDAGAGDAGAEDAGADDAAQGDAGAEDASPEDASVDDAEPGDAASDSGPDAPPIEYAIDASGREGCLAWTMRAEFDEFDFKNDDFLVRYEVLNECPESFLFRMEHINDFFALAVHQDGELWTYLGLCPGEGAELNWTFRTVGEGIGRAYVWQAGNHEALLEQCGVEWDPDAAYTLVGYGARELTSAESYSEIYELTPPIPIRIEE